MNKRQYKKIKKTKTERQFLNFLKEKTNIRVLEKDKFYLFEMNTTILNRYNFESILNPIRHFAKYLESIGIHIGFMPDGIFVNDFNSEQEYLDYLKNVKLDIEKLIEKLEEK